MMRRVCGMAALLMLGACGSAVHEPVDPTLQQALQVGADATSQNKADEAVGDYRKAFTLALAHDNAQGVGDAGYNLAVMQIAQKKPQDALTTVAQVRAALATRGQVADPSFDLLEGAALHKLGRDPDSVPHLQAAMAQQALLPRAALILAHIGDEGGRPDLVTDAQNRVSPLMARKAHADPTVQADAQEIGALYALSVQRDPRDAEARALRAADLRRAHQDYAAMARALALAARARDAFDPDGAKALWLRAAQAAKAQGDGTQASLWFARAGVAEGATVPVR